MKQFKILYATSYEKLEEQVNKLLPEGWVPHGEMVPVRTCEKKAALGGIPLYFYEYTQSMILHKDKPKESYTAQQDVINTILGG